MVSDEINRLETYACGMFGRMSEDETTQLAQLIQKRKKGRRPVSHRYVEDIIRTHYLQTIDGISSYIVDEFCASKESEELFVKIHTYPDKNKIERKQFERQLGRTKAKIGLDFYKDMPVVYGTFERLLLMFYEQGSGDIYDPSTRSNFNEAFLKTYIGYRLVHGILNDTFKRASKRLSEKALRRNKIFVDFADTLSDVFDLFSDTERLIYHGNIYVCNYLIKKISDEVKDDKKERTSFLSRKKLRKYTKARMILDNKDVIWRELFEENDFDEGEGDIIFESKYSLEGITETYGKLKKMRTDTRRVKKKFLGRIEEFDDLFHIDYCFLELRRDLLDYMLRIQQPMIVLDQDLTNGQRKQALEEFHNTWKSLKNIRKEYLALTGIKLPAPTQTVLRKDLLWKAASVVAKDSSRFGQKIE